MTKKMMSMLLTLLVTSLSLSFFGIGDFGFSVYGSAYLIIAGVSSSVL
jgi:hypothetical protein